MGAQAKSFVFFVAAGVAAALITTWAINNVRTLRRAVGSL